MWITSLVALLILAFAGFTLARVLARLPRALGIVGVLLLLALVVMLGLSRRIIAWSFIWPMTWVGSAYITPFLMALVIPALLDTLRRQLRRPREKALLGLLMWVGLIYFSFIPIVLPVIVRPYLARTPPASTTTAFAARNRLYSCGPAAAVTALLRLGIDAQEGPIGIGARTAPITGTDAQMLADTINRLYGRSGVHAEYRRFASVDDLVGHTPVIVSLRLSAAANHYVTVLAVHPNWIVVGDPLSGLRAVHRADFEREWHAAGITITRHRRPRAPPALIYQV